MSDLLNKMAGVFKELDIEIASINHTWDDETGKHIVSFQVVKEPTFEDGEIVLVSDDRELWLVRVFKNKRSTGFRCYDSEEKRSVNTEHRAEDWKHCKKWKQ